MRSWILFICSTPFLLIGFLYFYLVRNLEIGYMMADQLSKTKVKKNEN